MNLSATILEEHSKAQCNKIVAWVGRNPQRFDELLQLVLQNKPIIAQRASWPMSYCAEAYPKLLQKHLSAIIPFLETPGLHNAIRRNSIRALQLMPIPQVHHGAVMHLCFNFLMDPQEAVAVKACCLTVLGNLSKAYPDIIPEIKYCIAELLPTQMASIKSRVKQLQKQWQQMENQKL